MHGVLAPAAGEREENTHTKRQKKKKHTIHRADAEIRKERELEVDRGISLIALLAKAVSTADGMTSIGYNFEPVDDSFSGFPP